MQKFSLNANQTMDIEQVIFNSILDNLKKYMNKHRMGKGIWYSDDYIKYLKNKGISHEITDKIFDEWYDGYANIDFFDKTGEFSFKLKKGVKPSDALLAFLEGPTISDCGDVTLAIYYKVILDLIGKDKFDRLFNHNFSIQPIIEYPMSELLFFPDTSSNINIGKIGRRPLKLGAHLHFSGIKWYQYKHPAGFSGGWNVLYVGDRIDNNHGIEQLFIGHGINKPLSEREINNLSLREYNFKRDQKDMAVIKQYNLPEYDIDINELLRDYYIIDKKEFDQDPTKFLVGFIPTTVVSIKCDRLFQLI